MSSIDQSDHDRLDSESVPPFWIHEGAHGDARYVDPLVVAASRENWSWAFWLIRRQLNDGGRLGQIVERVAIDVTKRLMSDPQVGRNLGGYYRTAFIRTVQTIAIRENRISYEGATRDLESTHQLSAPNWTKVLEDRMILKSLLPFMSHPVRQIMHYRQLDYSWKQIAHRLSLTEKQAKSRFYYGAQQAHQALCAAQQQRANPERNRRNGLE
jgi:hypothetical protein